MSSPPQPVDRGMSKVRVHISVSADGYVAGPNQSLENPLGEAARACTSGWSPFERSASRTVRKAGT